MLNQRLLRDDAFMIYETCLTTIWQFSVVLFLVAVHAHHLVSILPIMTFMFVVAFIAAVLLVTARWNHPVCYVLEVVALMRDINSASAYDSDLRDLSEGGLAIDDEFEGKFRLGDFILFRYWTRGLRESLINV
jgi:hypothetical protein